MVIGDHDLCLSGRGTKGKTLEGLYIQKRFHAANEVRYVLVFVLGALDRFM